MHGSVHREPNLITVQQGATYSVVRAPDNGCQHSKHVELSTEI